MADTSQVSGTGFFGKGYWGRKMYWFTIPTRWRTLDAENGNLLEKMMTVWGDFSETFIDQINAMPDQGNPYLVRTESTEVEWFYVTGMMRWTDDDKGEVVRLIGERKFADMPGTDENTPPSGDDAILAEWYPWFPYAPISKVGRWWKTRHADSLYEVINVRSRNYDPPELFNEQSSLANEVWVTGGDMNLQFDYSTGATVGVGDGSQRPQVALPVGNIRLEKNTTSVIGNAKFTMTMQVSSTPGGTVSEIILFDVDNGDETGNLYVDGSTVLHGTVSYLSGKVDLDLSDAGLYSAPGEDIAASWVVQGYFFKFFAPPMIDYLAGNFAFDNDHNDPEDVQRSTIANVTKYMGKKATEDSYVIRGKISLFSVLPLSLFKICTDNLFNQFPAGTRYEINGKKYTSADPSFLRYNAIRADEQLYDYNGGFSPSWITLVDNILVGASDDRWDGMTIGQAYALDVTQGMWAPISPFNSSLRGAATVLGAIALTETQLDTIRISAGYAISISMLRCQYEAFNFQPGKFAVSAYVHGTTAPALSDTYFMVDAVLSEWTLVTGGATSAEDVGTWVIAIGTDIGADSPIQVSDDIAVRYLPGIQKGDCCTCRSKNIVMNIEANDEAYDYYTTSDLVENAIDRLKIKLSSLCPVQVSVIEWDVIRREQQVVYGVQNGAETELEIPSTVLSGASRAWLMVEYRGDLDTFAKGMYLQLQDSSSVELWSAASQYTGYSDTDTWYTVESDLELNVLEIADGVKMIAEAAASSTFGDVRWTIRYLKKEN